MPTRAEVLELLDRGATYETVGEAFGIAPGKAYMIATGRPADGAPDGDQALVNPRAHNPTEKPVVVAWVRERARHELSSPESS
ncbi:hypothetical protein [Baekduia sp.]|jgi:hypothetical protein|uniref:hypothetical protein n=1 Tax=Baekduia sp. TaxID=2600305 RepID=UPI002E05F645|nr:hypothetical protein [Baekduia sp.]